VDRDGSHRGASVAGRWPVRAVHEVDLHLTDRTHDHSCGTVLVEVDSPVGPLLVRSHGCSWACSTSCSAGTATPSRTPAACGSSPAASRWRA
jgi:hypothetical protein